MIGQLLSALIASNNEAADAVLLEALRLGTPAEQGPVLEALVKRKTIGGLCGVIEQFDQLTTPHQQQVLDSIKIFHSALREASRSGNIKLRTAALTLIDKGQQGKLAYLLAENLHEADATISKIALDALVGLAHGVVAGARKLQQEPTNSPDAQVDLQRILADRGEIEQAVARAMDVHRGRHGQELLRAALLLADHAGSRTFAILKATKHGGQSALVRRLQQPPAAEHVEAFLLGASHAGLRSHFGSVMAQIEEAPVLDAMLRKTHWLKDNMLQLCMHQVGRGMWWEEHTLLRDIDRRPSVDAALIGEWIASSGMHDVMQDERLRRLAEHSTQSFSDRLRLLRICMRRKRGSSTQQIARFLDDPDERIARMAARELIRRRPMEFENLLLQKMVGAHDSVRRLIGRAIGHEGFEQFWRRYDLMPLGTRRQAGRAMLKLLPDAEARLSRKLTSGSPEQRVKALQIVQDMNLIEAMRHQVLPLCHHPNAKLRSKAVSMLAEMKDVPQELLVEKLMHDPDARVRANVLDVIEGNAMSCLPLVAERARSSHSRERANAIRTLHSMRVSSASTQLMTMLQDQRAEHRISAMWTLRKVGWWTLLNEVGKIARQDNNVRVRRYALGVLRGAADLFNAATQKTGT